MNIAERREHNSYKGREEAEEQAPKYKIRGLVDKVVRGVTIERGRLVECPRDGATDWRLGGWKRKVVEDGKVVKEQNHEVWVHGHGPVKHFPAIEDIVDFPKRFARYEDEDLIDIWENEEQ